MTVNLTEIQAPQTEKAIKADSQESDSEMAELQRNLQQVLLSQFRRQSRLESLKLEVERLRLARTGL